MPTKYTDVGGHATYYYYVGQTTLPDVVPDLSRGHKLILVHGGGLNGHFWHRQLDHLGRTHSPVALDLPAHGRSAGVEGLASVRAYADFLAAFADALKIDSAVIVGHSFGGLIAMDFAVRYQKRTRALVLIATAAKVAIPQARIDGIRAVAMGRAPRPFVTDGFSPRTVKENFDTVREGWGEQIRTDPRILYADVLAAAQADLRDQLGKIDKPALVLVGVDDPTTPPANAELLKSGIAGAELQIIEGAGHYLPIERPVEVNTAIERFLAELR